jgi:hypothetical protein
MKESPVTVRRRDGVEPLDATKDSTGDRCGPDCRAGSSHGVPLETFNIALDGLVLLMVQLAAPDLCMYSRETAACGPTCA